MKSRFHKKVLYALFFFIIFLIGGSIVYSNVEGWRYLDSAYFIITTITTIGYGDIHPITDIGKIFTMFFSFFGIAMALYFFSLFDKYIYKKTFQKELRKQKAEIKENVETISKKNKKLFIC